VSKDELLAGAKRFFGAADEEKKGKLGEKAIADELNRLFQRLPNRGPFGGGPPGGGTPPRRSGA
jgi:hypothetical protein